MQITTDKFAGFIQENFHNYSAIICEICGKKSFLAHLRSTGNRTTLNSQIPKRVTYDLQL